MPNTMFKKQMSTVAEFPEGSTEGYVKCIISKYNVIDRDGDVIVKGAIPENVEVKLCSWGHGWGDLPVGKGRIYSQGEYAIFEGTFFMDTLGGQETYKTVKNLGTLGQWSWGFSSLESHRGEVEGKACRLITKVEAFEVSPVLVGANQHTSTLEMKSADEASMNDTETSIIEETTSEVSEELSMEADVELKDAENVVEEDDAVEIPETTEEDLKDLEAGDEETELKAEEPIIELKEIGDDNTSNVAAMGTQIIGLMRDLLRELLLDPDCSTWKMRELLCALSEVEYIVWSEVYDEAVETARESLAMKSSSHEEDILEKRQLLTNQLKNLAEYGIIPIDELDTDSVSEDTPSKKTYLDQATTLLADVESLTARSKSISEMRLKVGRKISSSNVAKLNNLTEGLKAAIAEIENLISTATPIQKDTPSESDETISEKEVEVIEEVKEETIVDSELSNRIKAKMREIEDALIFRNTNQGI